MNSLRGRAFSFTLASVRPEVTRSFRAKGKARRRTKHPRTRGGINSGAGRRNMARKVRQTNNKRQRPLRRRTRRAIKKSRRTRRRHNRGRRHSITIGSNTGKILKTKAGDKISNLTNPRLFTRQLNNSGIAIRASTSKRGRANRAKRNRNGTIGSNRMTKGKHRNRNRLTARNGNDGRTKRAMRRGRRRARRRRHGNHNSHRNLRDATARNKQGKTRTNNDRLGKRYAKNSRINRLFNFLMAVRAKGDNCPIDSDTLRNEYMRTKTIIRGQLVVRPGKGKTLTNNLLNNDFNRNLLTTILRYRVRRVLKFLVLFRLRVNHLDKFGIVTVRRRLTNKFAITVRILSRIRVRRDNLTGLLRNFLQNLLNTDPKRTRGSLIVNNVNVYLMINSIRTRRALLGGNLNDFRLNVHEVGNVIFKAGNNVRAATGIGAPASVTRPTSSNIYSIAMTNVRSRGNNMKRHRGRGNRSRRHQFEHALRVGEPPIYFCDNCTTAMFSCCAVPIGGDR